MSCAGETLRGAADSGRVTPLMCLPSARRHPRPAPSERPWSTGAEVAGAPWQTRRPPPPRASAH